ncbi:hypothetical protein BRCH_02849 [Candidatus Burkholderia brachyanthoides]|nr:hypothetical protein BRCH_02849 [Candidatus Burkholderia brachyanthoides]
MSVEIIQMSLTRADLSLQTATDPFVGHDHDHLGTSIGLYGVTTREERETMAYALVAYSHLLDRNEQILLHAYADRIAASYDASIPQNAEVIKTLQHCGNYRIAVDVGSISSAISPAAVYPCTGFVQRPRVWPNAAHAGLSTRNSPGAAQRSTGFVLQHDSIAHRPMNCVFPG